MRLTVIILLLIMSSVAHAKVNCFGFDDFCSGIRRSSQTAPAYPSTSSSISLNPSAVPTAKSLGVEMIYFKPSPDFALVTGTGRVGAAISPTAAEETFFGNPGFEQPSEYLQRHIEKKKLKSQKIALATAVNIWKNKRRGLKQMALNLGVQGRYNKITESIKPGGGVSGIVGPITFGYAQADDEYAIDDPAAIPFKYKTTTYNVGLSLTSLALDYSNQTIKADEIEDIKIQLLTASLLLERWIITASQRTEVSLRPEYDRATQSLVTKEKKSDLFGGVQFAAHEKILLGVFYNYFLLDDVSVGVTIFAF